jgi:uncharacterized protein YndB with AHSA1/START domain
MNTTTAQTTKIYAVFIRSTPERVWDAITRPEFTTQYFPLLETGRPLG